MPIMQKIIPIQHDLSQVHSTMASGQPESTEKPEPQVPGAVRSDTREGCGKCDTCTCEQVEEPARLDGGWKP